MAFHGALESADCQCSSGLFNPWVFALAPFYVVSTGPGLDFSESVPRIAVLSIVCSKS